VYTADGDDRVHPHGSVLVVDGTVTAVGPEAEVDALVTGMAPEVRSRLQTLDARGMMVLPGLVNAHWHDMFAMRGAFRGALRPHDDRHDAPGFLARGGDMPLISSLFDRFCGLIDELTPAEAEAIARYSLWTQLVCGTTTLGDVGSLNRPEALATAARDLGIRCAVSTWAGDLVCDPGQGAPRRTRDADALLAELEDVFRACSADPTGLTRARPSAVYITNMSDELGAGLAGIVARHDSTFATHVGAQQKESEFVQEYFGLSPIRRLDKMGLLDDRLMAVHCAYADDGERQLLVDRGVHINHSPAKYGPSGEATLSHSRLITELLLAGVDVSLSTDGTTFPVGGMPENMRAAWQMHNEMQADQTALPPTRVLTMATRVAARGLRWDDQVGSLEVGKQGDAVLVPVDDWRYLLNSRPMEAFLMLGGSSDIHTAVVGGQVVLREGRSTRYDAAELKSEYLKALRSFTARIPGADPQQLDAVLAQEGN
jgi:cytosine/adenosine deaminase-related metal-dependent hydrolase